MKKLLSILLALTMIVGMTAFAAADGTSYEASAQGFGSQVKVTVTVADGKITAIDVDDSGETYQSNGVESLQPLIDAILEAGTTEGVDVVSGARIAKGARLKNCIVMRGCTVGEDARLDSVIADKFTSFSAGTVLTGSDKLPMVVPKGTQI